MPLTGATSLKTFAWSSLALMLDAGRIPDRAAGTEFDDIELRHNRPPQSRPSHTSSDAITKKISQSSHAAHDASPLHTVLDVREDTHQPREDSEGGLPGPSTEAGHERQSTGSLAQQVEDDGEDEVGSESDGCAEDLPDEESFLAQLQRLDHEGKLQNLSSAHAPVSCLSPGYLNSMCLSHRNLHPFPGCRSSLPPCFACFQTACPLAALVHVSVDDLLCGHSQQDNCFSHPGYRRSLSTLQIQQICRSEGEALVSFCKCCWSLEQGNYFRSCIQLPRIAQVVLADLLERCTAKLLLCHLTDMLGIYMQANLVQLLVLGPSHVEIIGTHTSGRHV